MDPREFKKLRTSIGWTQERLAQELGITARQIINYEGGKTPIKAFIAKQFKALASEILEQEDSINLRLDSEKIPEYMKSQNITANYYPDISVSAGYGRALLNEEQATTITIPVGILGNITGLNLRKRYDVLHVYGDSMLPYIKDGEIALIERTEQASNGDVVIANIRDDLYIKYFERHPLGKWVKLRSHNKEYSDIELVGDEIEMLHIVGVLRATISVKVF
ncbi:MAG: helix-turn-helix domain-containing protein [Helicobacter sp.]|nr:helix-turn-helix domain-containing protein [Helicobacter sp.]